MSKVTRIEGYDEYGYQVIEINLPTDTQAVQDGGVFIQALDSWGITAQEAADNIAKVCDFLRRHSTFEDINEQIKCITAALGCRVDELERSIYEVNEKLSDLRSVVDVLTENPNQKDDLEIKNQIEVNPFLPGFIDLDSEEYLQQRPLWDFTVDF